MEPNAPAVEQQPPVSVQPPAPAPEAAPQTPTGFPVSQILDPEQDPNHTLQVMINKRKAKKNPEKEEKAEIPEKKDDKAEEKPRLNSLIADALKFTKREKAKPADEPAKEEKKPEAKAEKPPEEEKKPDKTIVSAKKKPDEPLDTAKLVADTANSVAQAVAGVMKPASQPATEAAKPETSVEDTLKADDRQEYIVAKHLSETNPKFKGAEKVVLEHIKKSEEYAARWEAANQGKLFDPDADEHDEFYASLEKPWSDSEFQDALIDIKANQIVEKKLKGFTEKTKEIELNSARMELAPAVDKAFASAAGHLVKAMGDDINETIMKHGFSKLEESDPIVAEVLTQTLGPLRPIIETAIQIDDPQGRFAYNPNNELHQQWGEILLEGEAMCSGKKDDHGRMFASRMQYSKMSKTQKEKHWYLTSEHIIKGVVEFAAKTAKEIAQKEKERITKVAQSMGYTAKEAEPKKTEATDKKEEKKPEVVAPAAVKPVSPSAGGDAKIDSSGKGGNNANAKAVHLFAKTLGMTG